MGFADDGKRCFYCIIGTADAVENVEKSVGKHRVL